MASMAMAFLGDRSQSILVDGVRSKEEAVVSGMPQGTVLGPLMFLLYINDMPEHVHTGTRCRLFADDTLLHVQSHRHHSRPGSVPARP